MSTQNHNLYDVEAINAIRREFGISVTESMASAVEDVKDNIVSRATDVADTVAGVARQGSRDVAFFVLGGCFTFAVIILTHFI